MLNKYRVGTLRLRRAESWAHLRDLLREEGYLWEQWTGKEIKCNTGKEADPTTPLVSNVVNAWVIPGSETNSEPEVPPCMPVPAEPGHVSENEEKVLKVFKWHKDAVVPKRATACSAGYDLVSIVYDSIKPGFTSAISTGIGVHFCTGPCRIRLPEVKHWVAVDRCGWRHH